MTEANNDQSVSQPDRPKPSRHNAKRLPFTKLRAIIHALANNESICSITRDLRVSRHNVLAIRKQYVREIETARERIAVVVELRCYELAHEALKKIGRQIQVERSPLRLVKIFAKLTDKAMMLEAPVQTHTPEPFELKFGKLRRAKRNEKLSSDQSVWHEVET